MTSLAVAVAVPGDTATTAVSQRYQVIVLRNAFGLKPIPPPPKPAETPPPMLNVVFTGITVLDGVKKAYFKVIDPRIPRGQFNAILYPCIAEGQRAGVLEVLLVDEKAGMVKVRQAGIIRELTFEENGNESSPASAFTGKPGVSYTVRGRPPIPVPYQRMVRAQPVPILRRP